MDEILQILSSPGAWIALLTLVFLEVVLGIDNVVFVSITSSRLPAARQKRARTVGLLLAMTARIGLLFAISVIMRLTEPLFTFSSRWVSGAPSWQSVIVFLGGMFLLYKSVTEVHRKLEGKKTHPARNARTDNFWGVIAQIVILDMVFSFDSILTAVGMIGFKTYGYAGSMAIMITAIVVSVAIMLAFAGWISRVIERYPSIQMLALSFLLLIAVTLIVESAHLSAIAVLGKEVGEISRGYIYFAIAFSLMVEFFNIRSGGRRLKRRGLRSF